MARPKKDIETKKNSTLAIDSDTSLRLDIFCKKYTITKKEFISLSLDYFERTGVNPYSQDVVITMQEMNDKLTSIVQLQADAAVKLTGIQHTTDKLDEKQEITTKLLEAKTDKKRYWWQKK